MPDDSAKARLNLRSASAPPSKVSPATKVKSPASAQLVVPVILCGGSGTRLWPLSRGSYPKQFLPLLDERSLLCGTAERVADRTQYAASLVVCASDQGFLVSSQLKGHEPTLLCEATAKNTAFAIAVAAEQVAETDPTAVMLVLAADHAIDGQDDFDAAVNRAASAARRGFIAAFGCKPTWPETGYGYILPGEALAGIEDTRAVARFVEKPDRRTAEAMIENGRYLWNSGIFVATAATFLEQIAALAPATAQAARQAYRAAERRDGAIALGATCSAEAPDVSFDVAVMEKTSKAAVVMGHFAWTDVGSWKSVWMKQPHDSTGTFAKGNVVHSDVKNASCSPRSASATSR